MSDYVEITGMDGPLFDGTAEQILVDGIDTIAEQLANKAVTDIWVRLDLVLRNPSGYYRSQIGYSKLAEGSYSVSDNDVPYGPWLEGIGSRNQISTFKGYHTFEIIGDRLENEVEPAVNDALDQFLERLA